MRLATLTTKTSFIGEADESTKRVRGPKPLTLITDTTGEIIKTKSASPTLKRGVSSNLLNPKWCDLPLEHVSWSQNLADIVELVEYLIGFAATIGVESHVFSRVAELLVFDEETLKRFVENNQYVAHAVMERLVEAHQRGFWEATEDELERFKNAYLSLDDMLDR